MSTYLAKTLPHYSQEAYAVFDELDNRVEVIFSSVKNWRGWEMLEDPRSPREKIIAFVQEILQSIVWYQGHTTEAGFHMFGRLPKDDVRLIQALCGHKAEEAEHGVWAKEDYSRIGGHAAEDKRPASPATFVVAAVWWRMATVGRHGKLTPCRHWELPPLD